MTIIYCDFMAGCIAGACGVVVGHPFDTIKTWQQASDTHKVNILSSMYDIIVRNNGLNGFFRGITFPFLTSGALNSILFGIYGNELRRLQSICATEIERKKKWAQHVFIAGSEAGFIHSFFACPIELVKIRLQTQNHHNYYRQNDTRGAINCVKRVFRTEGFFGFYRGLAPMICRDVFPYGIYMLTYDHAYRTLSNIEWISEKRKKMKENNAKYTYIDMSIPIVAGAVAGVMSWILVIPFDVIKTIMQAESDPAKHRRMTKLFKSKTNKYGWRIFFRGSWILIMRSIPTNSATFLGYSYALEKCQILSNVKPL